MEMRKTVWTTGKVQTAGNKKGGDPVPTTIMKSVTVDDDMDVIDRNGPRKKPHRRQHIVRHHRHPHLLTLRNGTDASRVRKGHHVPVRLRNQEHTEGDHDNDEPAASNEEGQQVTGNGIAIVSPILKRRSTRRK
jgi:hypothetical protein